jgi:hypothetical protein
LAVVILLVLLLPGASPAGKEDLVGTKVVEDMKIEFYMESSKKGIVMTSGKKKGHDEPGIHASSKG